MRRVGPGSAGGRPRSGRRSWRRTPSGRMLFGSEKRVWSPFPWASGEVVASWAPAPVLLRLVGRPGVWAAGHSFARWCWHGVVRQGGSAGRDQSRRRPRRGRSDNKRSAPSQVGVRHKAVRGQPACGVRQRTVRAQSRLVIMLIVPRVPGSARARRAARSRRVGADHGRRR